MRSDYFLGSKTLTLNIFKKITDASNYYSYAISYWISVQAPCSIAKIRGSTIFGEIIFHKAACFELYNYMFEMIIGNYFSST